MFQKETWRRNDKRRKLRTLYVRPEQRNSTIALVTGLKAGTSVSPASSSGDGSSFEGPSSRNVNRSFLIHDADQTEVKSLLSTCLYGIKSMALAELIRAASAISVDKQIIFSDISLSETKIFLYEN